MMWTCSLLETLSFLSNQSLLRVPAGPKRAKSSPRLEMTLWYGRSSRTETMRACMVTGGVVKPGEVWLVNLDPTFGSEIQKTGPCVIISPPEIHDHLRTAIVAPMTTKSRPAPFRISVKHAGKMGLILLDQIRTVDKARLVNRVGTIVPAALTATLLKLGEMFAE